MSNTLAEVSPNPVNIIISNNDDNKSISYLTLTNITNDYLIYKSLINNRGVLHIKNPTSFIPPSQSVKLEVQIIDNCLSKEEYNRTRLLIMFIQSNEKISSIQEAKKLYQIFKNENIEKQETLINLNFINEDENENEENNNNADNNNNFENNSNEKITYVNYSQLKNELESKNKEITNNLETQRKRLENLVAQNNKLSNVDRTGKKKKYYNLDNLILIFTILVGLIIGSNFACGYNYLFHKSK
jgi:hypothetical protein